MHNECLDFPFIIFRSFLDKHFTLFFLSDCWIEATGKVNIILCIHQKPNYNNRHWILNRICHNSVKKQIRISHHGDFTRLLNIHARWRLQIPQYLQGLGPQEGEVGVSHPVTLHRRLQRPVHKHLWRPYPRSIMEVVLHLHHTTSNLQQGYLVDPHPRNTIPCVGIITKAMFWMPLIRCCKTSL